MFNAVTAQPHARKHFFGVVIPQQIIGLIGFAHLFYTEQWAWLAVAYVSWFLIYVMGEGIFLHRYFSHRTFECNPIVAKVFALFALMGGFGGPITYRAIHIGMHHAHSDQPGDAHSPAHGLAHAIWGWHLTLKNLPLTVCKSLFTDPFYVFLDKHVVAIWWSVTLALALIDWRLALYAVGIPGMLCFWFAAITNAACHSVGSRRFDTKDNSRNLTFLSPFLLQGSSVLQNNHHAYPNRYHDSHAWYEVDIGKWIIPLIATKTKPL